jgi:hypothetical protein
MDIDIIRAVVIGEEAIVVSAYAYSAYQSSRCARRSSGVMNRLHRATIYLSIGVILLLVGFIVSHVENWGEALTARVLLGQIASILLVIGFVMSNTFAFKHPPILGELVADDRS